MECPLDIPEIQQDSRVYEQDIIKHVHVLSYLRALLRNGKDYLLINVQSKSEMKKGLDLSNRLQNFTTYLYNRDHFILKL